jgi:pyrroline-5-carboxylate reductase
MIVILLSLMPSIIITNCNLGAGNMAEAIINALSRKEGQNMSDVRVYDLNTERLTYLKSTYNITVSSGPEEGIQDAEVVMLSVKPQNVTAVAKSLPQPPRGLLLSIVAGCTIDNLKTSFRTDKVVRSMPNTPAMVLEGITGKQPAPSLLLCESVTVAFLSPLTPLWYVCPYSLDSDEGVPA